MRLIHKKIRTANRHFFEESDIRKNRKQKQHPYLVLKQTKTRMKLEVVYTAEELLSLPDDTRVLAQWKGRRRSDYFRFTVREFKNYIEEHPPVKGQRV